LFNWWQHKAWRDYASRRFNFYARTRKYRVQFDPEIRTAAVDRANKNVYLNPLWRPHKFIRPGLRHKDKRLTIVNGFIAHEAAHVRFSPEKVPQHFHGLWNGLEDERIERLQAHDYRHDSLNLKTAFCYIGDGIIKNLEPVTPLEGTLFWRFFHDRGDLTFSTTDLHTWTDVKPLVEACWSGSAEQTLWIAEVLWKMLGEPEFVPPDFTTMFERGAAKAEEDRTIGDEHMPLDHPELLELELRREVEGPARDLGKELVVRQNRLKVPSRTRGKLSLPRVISRKEQPFLKKPDDKPPLPLFTLIWDVSSSMAYFGAHPHAQLAAALVNRASEIAGVKRQIITFGEVSHLLASPTTPHELTFKTIVKQKSTQSDTRLSPALKQAFKQLGKQIIVIVSDGALSDDDEQNCKDLVRGKCHFVAPVLLAGTDDSAYQRIFHRSYVVDDARNLPATLKTFLTNITRL
jgi:hypothetical protein